MAAIAAACTLAAAAQTKDYTLRLEDFDELRVVDGINVEVSCSEDSAGMVTFTCAPALADVLMFESGKGRLKVQVAIGEDGPRTGLPTVHAYCSTLTRVENSGDSIVAVSLTGPQTQFKARVIGNGTIVADGIYTNAAEGRISTGHGHIVMRGKAARVKLSNIGTGPIEAGALTAKEVKCWVLGTGDIDCNASESLNIVGAGSGTVYYTGSPKTLTNRSIGVKAVQVGEPTDTEE